MRVLIGSYHAKVGTAVTVGHAGASGTASTVLVSVLDFFAGGSSETGPSWSGGPAGDAVALAAFAAGAMLRLPCVGYYYTGLE